MKPDLIIPDGIFIYGAKETDSIGFEDAKDFGHEKVGPVQALINLVANDNVKRIIGEFEAGGVHEKEVFFAGQGVFIDVDTDYFLKMRTEKVGNYS